MAKLTIKGARQNAGYRQRDMAHKLDMPIGTYIDVEKGKVYMTITDFSKFCELTNCEKDDIVLPTNQLLVDYS